VDNQNLDMHDGPTPGQPNSPDKGRIGGFDRPGQARPQPRLVQTDRTLTQPKANSRITVVEHITYSVKSGNPMVIPSRFGRNMLTEEQPYQRQLTIDGTWRKLELGWLDECRLGMVIIENNEGKRLQRIPSPAEVASINARIIEVWFEPPKHAHPIKMEMPRNDLDMHDPPEDVEPRISAVEPQLFACLLLPPGESQRYTPGVRDIWVRCQSETAKIVVTLLPG
jgi:hypothetical protein